MGLQALKRISEPGQTTCTRRLPPRQKAETLSIPCPANLQLLTYNQKLLICEHAALNATFVDISVSAYGETGICGTVTTAAKASMERHISVITLYFR